MKEEVKEVVETEEMVEEKNLVTGMHSMHQVPSSILFIHTHTLTVCLQSLRL